MTTPIADGTRTLHRLLRLALVAIVALVAAAGVAGQVSHADGGYVDITGKNLGVHIRYPSPQTGKLVEQPIPTVLLSADTQKLLSTPLSDMFDQIWSGTKDADGKTMRDRTCDSAKLEVQSIVAGQGQSAYNISCSLAAKGSLRAMVQDFGDGSVLSLSYWLPGNTVSFTSTMPDCGGTLAGILTLGASCAVTSGAGDPTFTVAFDGELLITMTVPATPCQLSPQAVAKVHDASITGTDLTADIAKLFDPSGFESGVESLDATQQSISLAPLQSTLDQLTNACSLPTVGDDGFSRFDAVVSAKDGLVFRLIHPQDAAPRVGDASVPDPSVPDLIPPTLGADQSEVKAGGQLTVSGSSFSGAHATDAQISWDDTTSGAIAESDVEWGRKGGKLQTVTLSRAPWDNKNTFAATDLTPGTTYEFKVRDCDQLTCTPYSAPIDVKTAAKGSDTVDLYLDSMSAANKLDSATLQPDGTFSTTPTIPATTAAGKHTLYAQLSSNGQQASVEITVVGAGDSLQPSIEVIDPTTNTIETTMGQGNSLTLRGAGFTSGTVTVSLGTAGGKTLGTVKAGKDGTFKVNLTMPFSTTGSVTLVASEPAGSQTLQATTSITVLAAPR